ncbi:VTC domain-containing protein [Candidatus Dojkabacteria bacterium]|nr:VTC domain-containing protein [Candidatus Dojkabacteria bacterium]
MKANKLAKIAKTADDIKKGIQSTDGSRGYRYERKFYVPELSKQDLANVIKCHPYFFREIYYERQVSNIYFDTPDLKFYFKNLDGADRRVKLRIRWYEDFEDVIEKPQLEYKIKIGLVGTKKVIPLDSFSITEKPLLNQIQKSLVGAGLDSDILVQLGFVEPVLMNHYRRRYFMSADKLFRLTIDSELHFHEVNKYEINWNRKGTSPGCVLELKYNHSNELLADRVSNFFKFRVTKFSKFAHGIEKLYGEFFPEV